MKKTGTSGRLWNAFCPILGLALAIGLGLWIVVHREFDSSDEGYLFYDAWAALGNSPPDALPSRHWMKNTGAILGLPFLLFPEARVIDLRLFSLGVWLAAHGLWFAQAAKWGGAPWRMAFLFLPLTLFGFKYPLLTYQSMPSFFGMLACACAVGASLAARPLGRSAWGVGLGLSLMGIPIAYTAGLAVTGLAVLWLWMGVRGPGFRPGFALGLAVGLVLWFWALPLESLGAPAEPGVSSEMAMMGNLSGILASRGPRVLVIVPALAALVLAGEGLRRLPPLRPSFRIPAVLAAFGVFLVAWTLGWRGQGTLVGYLAFALIACLPWACRAWSAARPESLPVACLGALLVLPAMTVSALGTVNHFYYLGYAVPGLAGLVLMPRAASGTARGLPAAAWTGVAVACLLALVPLVAATTGNRAAPAWQTSVRWNEPGRLQGLWFTPETYEALKGICEVPRQESLEGRYLVSPDFFPVLYCFWNKPCPFRWAYVLSDAPDDRAWLLDPRHRPLDLVLRVSEQRKFHGSDPRNWLRALGFPDADAEAATFEFHGTDGFARVRVDAGPLL